MNLQITFSCTEGVTLVLFGNYFKQHKSTFKKSLINIQVYLVLFDNKILLKERDKSFPKVTNNVC